MVHCWSCMFHVRERGPAHAYHWFFFMLSINFATIRGVFWKATDFLKADLTKFKKIIINTPIFGHVVHVGRSAVSRSSIHPLDYWKLEITKKNGSEKKIEVGPGAPFAPVVSAALWLHISDKRIDSVANNTIDGIVSRWNILDLQDRYLICSRISSNSLSTIKYWRAEMNKKIWLEITCSLSRGEIEHVDGVIQAKLKDNSKQLAAYSNIIRFRTELILSYCE